MSSRNTSLLSSTKKYSTIVKSSHFDKTSPFAPITHLPSASAKLMSMAQGPSILRTSLASSAATLTSSPKMTSETSSAASTRTLITLSTSQNSKKQSTPSSQAPDPRLVQLTPNTTRLLALYALRARHFALVSLLRCGAAHLLGSLLRQSASQLTPLLLKAAAL